MTKTSKIPAHPVDRWAASILTSGVFQLSRGNRNVFQDGDKIYSYGYHFELGRIIRENGKPVCILLNGDTYSVTTAGHQRDVRSAVKKYAPDVPSVIVPHAALNAALVPLDSVRAIDVKPDGAEYTLRTSNTLPSGTRDAEWGYNGGDFFDAREQGLESVKVTSGNQIVQENADGSYSWYSVRHWLGDALISVNVIGRQSRIKMVSSFDQNERARLYFLCELPRCNARTFADAIEALKPDAVKIAESMGRMCERQGDIFAVPMPGLSLKQLRGLGAMVYTRSDALKAGSPSAVAVQMVSLIGTAHTATEVATMPDGTQYARGVMYHDPQMMGEWRDRDHARRKMGDGKTWHLIQRNTVPVARGRNRQRVN